MSRFRGERWNATMNTHFVLHIHLSLTFFSTVYMYFFFSETEGVYGCLLKSTRELSPGIISSHCSKEWKLIGEGKETKVLQWITLALPSNAGEGKYHFGGWRPGFKWLGEHSVFERVWVWFPEPTSGSSILPAFPATRDLKKSSCFCGYLHLYAHTYTHKHTHQK